MSPTPLLAKVALPDYLQVCFDLEISFMILHCRLSKPVIYFLALSKSVDHLTACEFLFS